MKKSIIFVNKESFIYNEEKYSFDKISEINKTFRNNMKIIILEEELCVKQFKDRINRFRLCKVVDSIIDKDFPQNGDILYDYEQKNNVISIYYIKGAKRIEKLAENAKNIEVRPIQFIISKAVKRVLRNNNFTGRVLLKFQECYYYIFFNRGSFFSGIVKEDKESLLNKIFEDSDTQEIFVDNSAGDIVPSNKNLMIRKMNLRGSINENIYKK